MTQNQIAHNRAETEAAKAAEQERHNRKTEKIETLKAITGKNGIIGAGGTFLRGFTNDPAWYSNYPSLVQNGANLSFTHPAMGYLGVTGNTRSNFMIFDWVPTFGNLSGSDSDPLSIAAVTIYGKIRSAISGSRPYDRNDVLQVLLAIADIYSLTSELVRLYGVARWTSTINPAYRYIVSALGYNPENVLNNLSDLRYAINLIAAKLVGLPVPQNIPYFSRHIWLASNVFADTEQPKHKLYAFRQARYWHYDWENSRCILTNTPVRDSGSDVDWADVSTLINQEIDKLLNYEDVAIILGDIRRAYEGEIVELGSLEPDYMLKPILDDEVLTQIEAIPLLGDLSTDMYLAQSGTNLIYANENGDKIPFQLTYQLSNVDALTSVLSQTYNPTIYNEVDYYHEEDVSPEFNMVATRFMVNASVAVTVETENITFTFNLESFGSEVITAAYVAKIDETGLGTMYQFYTFTTWTSGRQWGLVTTLPWINQFRVAPKVFIVQTQGPKLLNWQPHFNASVPYNTLDNMHTTALMSQMVISPYLPASDTYSRKDANMQVVQSKYKGVKDSKSRGKRGKKSK